MNRLRRIPRGIQTLRKFVRAMLRAAENNCELLLLRLGLLTQQLLEQWTLALTIQETNTLLDLFGSRGLGRDAYPRRVLQNRLRELNDARCQRGRKKQGLPSRWQQ